MAYAFLSLSQLPSLLLLFINLLRVFPIYTTDGVQVQMAEC